MKKIIIFMIMLVITLSYPLNVTAKSDKTNVNNTVKSYFNLIKKSDIVALDKLAYSKNYKTWGIKEIKKTNALWKYVKKYNKKVSYKIKGVAVKGTEATVKVRVKYVDSTDVYPNIFAIALSDAFSGVDTEADDYSDRMFNRAVAMSKVKMRWKNINVKLKKRNGEWKIKSKNLPNIATADLIHSAEQLSD